MASKEQNSIMAKHMKDHPNQFPDSILRPWQGEGASARKLAKNMGRVPHDNAYFELGMVGGILAAKLGFGNHGVKEFMA